MSFSILISDTKLFSISWILSENSFGFDEHTATLSLECIGFDSSITSKLSFRGKLFKRRPLAPLSLNFEAIDLKRGSISNSKSYWVRLSFLTSFSMVHIPLFLRLSFSFFSLISFSPPSSSFDFSFLDKPPRKRNVSVCTLSTLNPYIFADASSEAEAFCQYVSSFLFRRFDILSRNSTFTSKAFLALIFYKWYKQELYLHCT